MKRILTLLVALLLLTSFSNTVFAEDFNINEALVIADKRMYEIKKEHHERYSMDVEKMIKKK